MKSLPRVALSAILIVLAVRVVDLFFRYSSGAGTARHHVESAATIFAAAAFALKYLVSDTARTPSPATGPLPAPVWWPVFCVAAIALYWPALFIGLLSDDYGLVARASAWDVSAVSAVLFRPVPLLLWSALLQAGAGPLALHLLNVVLHGTNAFLAGVLLGRWAPRQWGVTAGLLVLTAPIATETVVWCSGVFDVCATTLVLSAVLLSLRYSENRLPRATRVAFIAASLAAVLSKETAAVAPALVAIAAWASGPFPPALRRDLTLVAAVIVAFGLVRFLNSSETVEPLTKYVLQRAVFSGFGSLAVPYHARVIERFEFVDNAAVLVVVALLTSFAMTSGPRRDVWMAIAAVSWVLVSIVPVIPILVIPPDLQQSRYVYLAATGWAILLVHCAARLGGALSTAIGHCLLIGLVAMNSVATSLHLRPWIEAARMRDTVERAARANARMQTCPTIALSGLPDAVNGAYVFRNSVAEAFARDLALKVVTDRPACAFEWRDSGFLER